MNFFKDLLKGRFVGHPIHVILVHFPIALFPVSLLFDFIHYQKQDPSFSAMSFYCMLIGLIVGYVAAVFGLIDLTHLKKENVIINKAFIHAGINSLVVFSYTIIVVLRFSKIHYIVEPQLLFLVSNVVLNILLLISGYYGGDLIFRHKVGIED